MSERDWLEGGSERDWLEAVNPDLCSYCRRGEVLATGRCDTCGVEDAHDESNNPADVPEKGEPMEASSSTAKTTANGNGDSAAAEKEKRDPTRYHVLKKLSPGDTGSGPQYERLTKTAIAASSTTQAIELALADGHGNGTYIAVPERSFQEKSVKVEEVKTQRVVVG